MFRKGGRSRTQARHGRALGLLHSSLNSDASVSGTHQQEPPAPMCGISCQTRHLVLLLFCQCEFLALQTSHSRKNQTHVEKTAIRA